MQSLIDYKTSCLLKRLNLNTLETEQNSEENLGVKTHAKSIGSEKITGYPKKLSIQLLA